MEAIMLIGLPGSGKSTFYKQRFFQTHVRISLDLLKTRNRERMLLTACLTSDQPYVVDNTNPTKAERAYYIQRARLKRFRVIGYYFAESPADCLQRNAARPKLEQVPAVAVYATANKLQPPSLEEGFDQLFTVRLQEETFQIDPWQPDSESP
jgi:predicted kinase